MPNPWLTVPLADYEGHMQSPEVGQLPILSELFAEALEFCRPRSVAILGIAGGNGLERIDNSVTERVVGFDLNPSYLEAVRQRYSNLRGLELHCCDLAEERIEMEPVELVHAALILEHAGTGRCLENALRLTSPRGAFSVLLQLPGEPGHEVARTSFPTIQSLRSDFSLIDPESLRGTLHRRGFELKHQSRRFLPGGKAFWMGLFARAIG